MFFVSDQFSFVFLSFCELLCNTVLRLALLCNLYLYTRSGFYQVINSVNADFRTDVVSCICIVYCHSRRFCVV